MRGSTVLDVTNVTAYSFSMLKVIAKLQNNTKKKELKFGTHEHSRKRVSELTDAEIIKALECCREKTVILALVMMMTLDAEKCL